MIVAGIKKEMEGHEIWSVMFCELVGVHKGKAIIQSKEVNLTENGWKELWNEYVEQELDPNDYQV